MNISNVGSNVNLLFQAKFATFTPDQFTRAFKDRSFTLTQGPANISSNPSAQPVTTNYFSKNNLVVFYNANENLIIFQIINTLDFSKIYEEEIKKILVDLNFVEESANMMSLECTVRISSTKSPSTSLTSLVKKDFIDDVRNITEINDLGVFTISLNSVKPTHESMRVMLEPLANDVDGTYVLAIWYKTKETSKFSDFVNRFGVDMIKKIAEAASKNV